MLLMQWILQRPFSQLKTKLGANKLLVFFLKSIKNMANHDEISSCWWNTHLLQLIEWALGVDYVHFVSNRCTSPRLLHPLSVSVSCIHVYPPHLIRWTREDPLTTCHSLRKWYWNDSTMLLLRSHPTGSIWNQKESR